MNSGRVMPLADVDGSVVTTVQPKTNHGVMLKLDSGAIKVCQTSNSTKIDRVVEPGGQTTFQSHRDNTIGQHCKATTIKIMQPSPQGKTGDLAKPI